MKDERNETLCRNIKKYRLLGKHDGIEYCKSAESFATFLGIIPDTYKKYESSAAVPTYDNLVKIAFALEVSIDKLLDYERPVLSIAGLTRFFLNDLGIKFKTKYSGEFGCKEYILEVPEEIKNDTYTWERMSFDKNGIIIYETPSLRRKLNWIGKKRISFTEDDFEAILNRYNSFRELLKMFSKNPFVRQLIFLGMVKIHRIETGKKENMEMMSETNEVFKFLRQANEFIPKLLNAMKKEDYYRSKKVNGKWEESEYWELLDEMNANLHSEQLRKIFLEVLSDYCIDKGMGEINVVRQQLTSKRRSQ